MLLRSIGGRLLKALAVVLGVVVVNFFLIRLAPGDPVLMVAGEAGSQDPAYVQQLRVQMELDQPLPRQLVAYLGKVVRLDLGYSYRSRVAVLALIKERMPATLLLMGSAFVFSLVAGVGLGVAAASRHHARRHIWADRLISSGALVVYATPQFWLALMLVIVFSVRLGWLPAFGMETVGAAYTGWARVGDLASHLLLPTLSLGCLFTAVYVHLTRAAMLDVMRMDFVKTARAKGLSGGRIIRAHVLRNALLPVITFAGVQLSQMAGGAIVTESVFAWPGIGSLMVAALLERDYQLLLGIFLTIAVMVIFFNLLVEAAYRIADPRIADMRVPDVRVPDARTGKGGA